MKFQTVTGQKVPVLGVCDLTVILENGKSLILPAVVANLHRTPLLGRLWSIKLSIIGNQFWLQDKTIKKSELCELGNSEDAEGDQRKMKTIKKFFRVV